MTYGGRFNSPGIPVLYLAATEAVAILESRVHNPRLNHLPRTLHHIEIPNTHVQTPAALGLALPSDWNLVPFPVSSQQFGDTWLTSIASLALKVPSVPGGADGNVLVNPAHPDFHRLVKVVGGRPFQFDKRLYKRTTAKRPGPK